MISDLSSENDLENDKLDEGDINDSLSESGTENAEPDEIKFNQDDLLNKDSINKDPKNDNPDCDNNKYNRSAIDLEITDPDKIGTNIPKPDNIKIDNPDKSDNFGNKFNKKNSIIPELSAQNKTKNSLQGLSNIGSVALEASLVFVNPDQSQGEVREIQQHDQPSTKIESPNSKKTGCIPDKCVIS